MNREVPVREVIRRDETIGQSPTHASQNVAEATRALVIQRHREAMFWLCFSNVLLILWRGSGYVLTCFINDLATFYFANCVAPPVDYWEVSSNLQIITSDDSSVTVESLTSSSTSGFVRAFFPFNNVVEKTFWMGVPTTPGYLNGPEIVSTASIVAYNGGVSEGATSYKWWLPYPFDTVSPIDYSSDNWQTYPKR